MEGSEQVDVRVEEDLADGIRTGDGNHQSTQRRLGIRPEYISESYFR